MSNIENIFARCVDDIQAGRASVSECLAAYPEHAGELGPMLGLQGALAEVGHATLSPAADTAILAAIASRGGGGPPPAAGGGGSWLWPWPLVIGMLAVLAAVAAVVTISNGGDSPAEVFQSGSPVAESPAAETGPAAGQPGSAPEAETAPSPAAVGGASGEAAVTAPPAASPAPADEREGDPGAVPVLLPPDPPDSPDPPAPPPETAGPALVINEILYNQAGGVDNEWIELFVRAADAVDVTGWVLSNQDGFIFTFPGFTAGPGAYLVIHTGLNSNNTTDPVHDGDKHHFYAGETAHKWDNTADDVVLLDGSAEAQTTLADGTGVNGRPVDYVVYGQPNGGQVDPPPVATDGTTVAFSGAAPAISGPDKGTSVSLNPNGADSDNGGDWSVSGEDGTTGPASEGESNTP